MDLPERALTSRDDLIPADPDGRVRRRLARSQGVGGRLRGLLLADVYDRLAPQDQDRVDERWRSVIERDTEAVIERDGGRVAERHGVSVRRQRRHMRALADRLILPAYYHKHGLWDRDRRAAADDLIQRHELKSWVYRTAHLGHEGLGVTAPLWDKLAFDRHCQERGVPRVPLVASIADGETTWLGDVPDGDLFVKPTRLKGGRNVETWLLEDGRYRRLGGHKHRTLGYVVRRYERQSVEQPVTIAPRVRNHPTLDRLGMDALCTVRLFTVLDERGDPEPVAAVLRMPSKPGVLVDNAHRGGLFAAVDIKTGTLGEATTLKPHRDGWRTSHPASEERIEGAALPMWDDVVSLAAEAQVAFAPRVVVGWDIAIAPDGPTVVEGNNAPGVDIVQHTHGPLGRHRLGELLLHHVERRLTG